MYLQIMRTLKILILHLNDLFPLNNDSVSQNIEQPFKNDDFVSQELTYFKITRYFINMMILYLKITT